MRRQVGGALLLLLLLLLCLPAAAPPPAPPATASNSRPVSSRWAIVVSTVVEPSSVCSVWAGEASRAAE
jgi:hypothetical protein